MSYQVFARKYRPQNFDSVIGQEHITQTLKNAISQNRLAHAYLFVGPRGVGKTSTARILAKALNCKKGPTILPCGECDACREIAQGNSLDVLEIDGASNNGVEQVRELRENVRFAPTAGKFKIYIIDEVHMLTSAAFNALLKTLEEPPAHVKFIFATTEPKKVLPTILSRCQRFDLRRIPSKAIAEHLKFIAQQEKFSLDDQAAEAIAKAAEGGLRDAESMLDQLVAFCGNSITETDVLSVFGLTAQNTVASLCNYVFSGNSSEALALVHAQSEAGKDFSVLMGDLIGYFRNLLVIKADSKGLKTELNADSIALLKEQAEKIKMDRLLDLIEQFSVAEDRMKWVPNKKLHFEIALIKAIQTLGQTTLTEVIDALSALREGKEPSIPQALHVPTDNASNSKSTSTSGDKKVSVPEEKLEPFISAPALAVQEEPIKSVTVKKEEIWPALIQEIRNKRPLISSWIEAGTLLGIDENICLIGFPQEQMFSMESILKPNNRKFLEELISNLAGYPLTLKCEIREGLTISSPPVAEKATTPDPMEAFKNDPLIQKALEIFKGEMQST